MSGQFTGDDFVSDAGTESLKEACHERRLIPSTGGREGAKLNGVIYHRASPLAESGQDAGHFFSTSRTVKYPNHLLPKSVKAIDVLDLSLSCCGSPLVGMSCQERDYVGNPCPLSCVGDWLERENKLTLGEKRPTLCRLTGVTWRVIDSGLWGFQPPGKHRRTPLEPMNLSRQIRELGGQGIHRMPGSG